MKTHRFLHLFRLIGIAGLLIVVLQDRAQAGTWHEYYNGDDDAYYVYYDNADTWYCWDFDNSSWYECDAPEDAGDEVDSGAYDEIAYGDASALDFSDVGEDGGYISGGEEGVPYKVTVTVSGSMYSGFYEGDQAWLFISDAYNGSYETTVADTTNVDCWKTGMHGFTASVDVTVYSGGYLGISFNGCEDSVDGYAVITDIHAAQVNSGPNAPCACTSSCSNVENNSVDVKIPFGVDTASGRGGAAELHISDDKYGPSIYDPNMLNISGGPDESVVYDANGSLRQVLTSQSFVNVVNVVPSQGYELDFYHPNQVSGPDANGVYTPTAPTPYEKWTFSDMDNSGGTALRIVHERDGAKTTYEYTWAEEPLPGNRGWSLTTSDLDHGVLRTETHSYTYDTIPGVKPPMRTEEHRLILNPDGTTASEIASKITYIHGLPFVTKETVGPDSANPQVTTYEYWDKATNPANSLRKKMVTDPNGHWIYYDAYSLQGTPLRWTEQYLNNKFSGKWPDPNNRNFAITFDASNPSQVIRTETESIGPTAVSRKWQVLNLWGAPNPSDKNNFRKTVDVVATKSSAMTWEDPSNLVTTTYLYDHTDHVAGMRKNSKFLIVNPDGTGTMYRYFRDNSTGDVTLVTTTGHVAVLPTEQNPYTAVIDQGNETTDVKDQYGNSLSNQTVNIAADGTRLIIADQVSTAFDDFGRPTAVSYFGGKYTETTTYGCCGVASKTDRYGIVTTTAYDGLKRVASITHGGITTQYKYDAIGHQTAIVIGPPGQEITQSLNQYDSNSEILWTKDGVGRQTIYSKTIDIDGYVVVAAINPNGSTLIQKSYADGAMYQVLGTAAAYSFQYTYGVNTDGCRSVTQTTLGSSGDIFEKQFTQNWRDFAGREWKMITPSPAGSENITSEIYYGDSGKNSTGHKIRTTSVGQPDMFYDYNLLGQVTAFGRGSLAKSNGVNALTETNLRYATYTPEGGTPVVVQQQTITQWLTETDAQETTNYSAVDGSGVWIIYDGRITSQTFSADTINATATETFINRDKSCTITVSRNGKIQTITQFSQTGEQLSKLTYTYDAQGRVLSQTDTHDGLTTYTYDNAGRVSNIIKPDGGIESHTYADTNQYGGKTLCIATSSGENHIKEYYPSGQLALSYGTGEYAAHYTYDEAGRQKTLTTWQHFTGDPSTSTGAAVTTWNYNAAGALVSKIYADGTGPTYTYGDNGKLQTRAWARGVVTSYTYDPASGALAETDYSDGTPSVVYSNFDRLGRPRQIRDGSGVRTLAYTHGVTTYEKYVEGPLAGFAVSRSLDANDQMTELSVQQNGVSVYDVGYAWNGLGRLGTVTWGNDTVAYGYEPNSNLIRTVTFAHEGATTLTTTKTYDNLQRLTEIDNQSAGGEAMNVAYQYNGRNERVQATREDGTYWQYGYDELGQVVAGGKHLADGTPIPGLQYGYDYDSMGNRQSTTTNGRVANYQTNRLNQYTSRDVPRALDIVGTANANATVTVNGQTATRTGPYWYQQLDFVGNNTAQWVGVDVQGLLEALTSERQGSLFLAAHPEHFTYDADGNLLADGRWTYAWDGENRLVLVSTNDTAVQTGVPSKKIVFGYDNRGRRISKTVYYAEKSATILFLYDNWNPLLVVDSLRSYPSILDSFVWSLDTSGTLQGNGGIGGLVAANLHNNPAFYCYDGNGNVIGLIDAMKGGVAARYDYDPFGNIVGSTGKLNVQNAFKFSTKYAEGDNSLMYYGLRYYSSGLGRWPNRDPIGESNDSGIYCFVDNNAIGNTDLFGLLTVNYSPPNPISVTPTLSQYGLGSNSTNASSGTQYTSTVTCTGSVSNGTCTITCNISFTAGITISRAQATSLNTTVSQIYGHEQRHIQSRTYLVQTHVVDVYSGRACSVGSSGCTADATAFQTEIKGKTDEWLNYDLHPDHVGQSAANTYSPVNAQGYDPLPGSPTVQ